MRCPRPSRRLRPTLLAACAVLAVTGAARADSKESLSGHGVNERPLRWNGQTPWVPVTWEGQPLAEIVSAGLPPLDEGRVPPDDLDLALPPAPPPFAGDPFALPAPTVELRPLVPPTGTTIPAGGALPLLGIALLAGSGRRRRSPRA